MHRSTQRAGVSLSYGNRRRTVIGAIALASTATVLTGCALSGAGASGTGLAGDLAFLPIEPDANGYLVQASDLAYLAEVTGQPKPEPEQGHEAFTEWAIAVSTSQSSLAAMVGPSSLNWEVTTSITDEIQEALGVSLLDVDSFTELATPPHSLAVLHGSYDTEQIDAALGERAEELWQFGDADGGMNLDSPNIVGPVGSATFLETDDRLTVAPRAATAIALRDDSSATLDDDAQAVATAEALDAAPWYTALMVHDPNASLDAGPLAEMDPEEIEAALGYEGLQPFAWLGLGMDFVDETHIARAVYAHDDAESAQANAERLEEIFSAGASFTGEPYANFFDLRDIEVEGELVIMTLEQVGDRPATAWNMVRNREALFHYW